MRHVHTPRRTALRAPCGWLPGRGRAPARKQPACGARYDCGRRLRGRRCRARWRPAGREDRAARGGWRGGARLRAPSRAAPSCSTPPCSHDDRAARDRDGGGGDETHLCGRPGNRAAVRPARDSAAAFTKQRAIRAFRVLTTRARTGVCCRQIAKATRHRVWLLPDRRSSCLFTHAPPERDGVRAVFVAITAAVASATVPQKPCQHRPTPVPSPRYQPGPRRLKSCQCHARRAAPLARVRRPSPPFPRPQSVATFRAPAPVAATHCAGCQFVAAHSARQAAHGVESVARVLHKLEPKRTAQPAPHARACGAFRDPVARADPARAIARRDLLWRSSRIAVAFIARPRAGHGVCPARAHSWRGPLAAPLCSLATAPVATRAPTSTVTPGLVCIDCAARATRSP
ncbi:uncharacterized protein V1518DRAFT_403380 [Limtongia smithiae]|uniref:uncharacterized protein n=1 Tax=Limtongia smithiae TaxID=1125753 RepID=UPI0034CE13A3